MILGCHYLNCFGANGIWMVSQAEKLIKKNTNFMSRPSDPFSSSWIKFGFRSDRPTTFIHFPFILLYFDLKLLVGIGRKASLSVRCRSCRLRRLEIILFAYIVTNSTTLVSIDAVGYKGSQDYFIMFWNPEGSNIANSSPICDVIRNYYHVAHCSKSDYKSDKGIHFVRSNARNLFFDH